jgi:signal peptidase I
MSDNIETQSEERTLEDRVETSSQTTTVVEEPPRRETRTSPEPEAHKSTFREYFESAVVTLIMAVFGMTFIVQAVKVPTGSMKNTIWIQDHLLVNKFIFGSQQGLPLPVFPARDIRRGDVVVFKFPGQPDINYVKRVIALPGETVEYDSDSHRVYINGQELPEHRLIVAVQGNEAPEPLDIVTDEGLPAGAKWNVYYYQEDESLSSKYYNSQAKYGVRQPFKVPVKGEPVLDEILNDLELRRIYDADKDGFYDSDQYFCMGDNRDNSTDSRFWGTAPRSSIVGRAMFVYWSVDRSDEDEEKSNPLFDFFTRTRWSRTGTLIK